MLVDLIVHNARIGAGDAAAATFDRFAVLGGRIVAVGNDVDQLQACERFDAGGRTVLPGFNDVHAHTVWYGTTLLDADLSAVRHPSEAVDIIAECAERTAPGEWIIAAGYNPVLLHGAMPDRDALDRASGGRPVWIKHASGHSCQLNGIALELTGVNAALGTEIEGGVIVVDEQGRPTGVLEERAMSFVQDVVLPYPLERIERALDLATAQYAREGLTSVTDAGVAGGWIGNAPGELGAYQNALDAGLLRTRIQVMPVIDVLPIITGQHGEPIRRGFGAGMRTGWGNDRLQLGPVKVFTDGSILGRTANVTEHFVGCPENHGYLQEDPEVMRERVLAAAAGGWSVALHAVGDAALDLALDIIEEAQRRYGRPRVPNRVEHGVVVRPDQIDRLAALGVACIIQPNFIGNFGEGMRRALGDKRIEIAQPARTQLDKGMALALSTDRPVAPGAPLAAIQGFVERLSEEGRAYSPEQRLTVEEALHAATIGSAQVTGQAAAKGQLAPGFLADFVVLDADPTQVPPSDIHAIPVVATAVGGEFTHRSAEL